MNGLLSGPVDSRRLVELLAPSSRDGAIPMPLEE